MDGGISRILRRLRAEWIGEIVAEERMWLGDAELQSGVGCMSKLCLHWK